MNAKGFYLVHEDLFSPATTSALRVNSPLLTNAQSWLGNELVAIVHLSLAGVQIAGSPSNILAEYLSEFLGPDLLQYKEINFDLSTEASSYSYARQMKEFACMIKQR
jgi:hypothetical protein